MDLTWPGPAFAIALDALGDIRPRAAILRARELGYTAIGISTAARDFTLEALGDSGVRDLSAHLARNGLGVSWVRAGDRGRFTVAATCQEDVERLVTAVGLARKLRCVAAVACVGRMGNVKSDAAESLRQALAYLCDVADRAGVTLALAPSRGEEALLDELLSSFRDAPVARLTDPGATLFSGIDPVDDIVRGPRIAAVAASDSSSDAADLAPGEGAVIWRDVLAALSARDYHGHVTVTFAPGKSPVSRAAAALEHLRRCGL